MPNDGTRRELIFGELREMTPACGEHGEIAMRFPARLAVYIEDNSLGVANAAETGFILGRNPDTVRAPDFAFIRQERIEAIAREGGYIQGAPDLAIELISPNDAYTEVESKVEDWLRAGCRMVVLVNPRSRSLKVYRGRNDMSQLGLSDVFDGGNVVPGFQLPVKRIFGEK
jgi:Uma2 family endonuclease